MIETQSETLGDRGFVYEVTQLGARDGGRLLLRIGKLLGAAVGGFVSTETAAVGFATVVDAIGEKDFDDMVTLFSARTVLIKPDGARVRLSDKGVFDLHFAGAYLEMMYWFRFALTVNYADFLGSTDQADPTAPAPAVSIASA